MTETLIFSRPPHEGGAPRAETQAPAEVGIVDQPAEPGRECANCVFWATVRGGVDGQCRRRAPSASGWPIAFAFDWCGQFASRSWAGRS